MMKWSYSLSGVGSKWPDKRPLLPSNHHMGYLRLLCCGLFPKPLEIVLWQYDIKRQLHRDI